MYYRLTITTTSVTEQYTLLKDIEFEKQQEEKRKLESIHGDRIKKIDNIIEEFPSITITRLEKKLLNFDGTITKEMNHIHLMSGVRSDTHLDKEQSLTLEIEKLNLEISRLKSNLQAKESECLFRWGTRTSQNKNNNVHELLCRIQQCV